MELPFNVLTSAVWLSTVTRALSRALYDYTTKITFEVVQNVADFGNATRGLPLETDSQLLETNNGIILTGAVEETTSKIASHIITKPQENRILHHIITHLCIEDLIIS